MPLTQGDGATAGVYVAISINGKLSHWAVSDVIIRDAPTPIRAWMEWMSETYLGKCKFKILSDGDMIADAKLKPKIMQSAHLW